MSLSGSAIMGIGKGSGEGRALEAARMAVNSPLLETSIEGASGVIFNVTGGPDMTLHEVNEAADIIYQSVDKDANIIFGSVIDDRIQGEIQITVIATGFDLKAQQIHMEGKSSVQIPSISNMSATIGLPPTNITPNKSTIPAPPVGLGIPTPASALPPRLEESPLWKNGNGRGSKNSVTEAARKLLDLPEFLRPNK